MTIQIKRWYDNKILYTAENAADVRQALEEATRSGADLRDAVLRGAVLSGAVLRGAVLRDADLSDADLRDADLSDADLRDADLSDAVLRGAVLSGAVLRGAVLRDADLSDADLRDADLSDADLRDAVLSGAVLRGAVLSGADLRDADLRDADLSDADDPRSPLHAIRLDLWAILDMAPAEADGVRRALTEGKVNGDVYGGDCCCLVGTIAAERGCAFNELDGIVPDGGRPAEAWFMPIRPGDAPAEPAEREGQFRARLAVQWIGEWRQSRERLVAAFSKAAA